MHSGMHATKHGGAQESESGPSSPTKVLVGIKSDNWERKMHKKDNESLKLCYTEPYIFPKVVSGAARYQLQHADETIEALILT
jgi:hypothetical protein